MTTVSTSPSMPVRTASKATDAGSPPSRPRTVSTPTRSPQVSSWSAAAARKVSAAPRTTLLPSPTSTRAILPTVVVLPGAVDARPRGRRPAGPSCRSVPSVRSRSGPRTAVSSRTSSSRSSVPDAVASTIDWVRSRSTIWVVARDPDVGGEEGLLDLLPVVLGQLLAGEDGEQAAAERGLRAGQPGAQPDQPAGRRRRRLEGQPRLGLGRRQLDRRRGRLGHRAAPGAAGAGRLAPAAQAGGGPGERRARRRVVVQPQRPPSPADEQADPGDQRDDEDRDRDEHEFHAAKSPSPTRVGRARQAGAHVRRPPARPASCCSGPLLRHVDPVSATVWVETDRPCEVAVLGRRARTFGVGGHHYALVVIDGLEPGSTTPVRGAPGRRAWSGRRPDRRSRPAGSGHPAAPARSGSPSGPAATPPPRRRTAAADIPPDALDSLRRRGGRGRPRTSGPTRWSCSATRSTPTS